MLIPVVKPRIIPKRSSKLAAAIEFIAGNDHFFLNISMAVCKSMLDAAHGMAGSSMVSVMARNGVEFGIRLSGLGERWFTAPAPMVNGLYFPNYSTKDAAPDLGDSAITETAGVDARRVVDSGILPVINTGIAHKEPGVGQIGAGVTRAPLECLTQAIIELEASWGKTA